MTKAEPFRLDRNLQERHPDVRVVVTDLPGQLHGRVDHEKRIIWLDSGLDPVTRRWRLAYEIGPLEQGPTPADRRLTVAFRRAADGRAPLTPISTEASPA